MTKLLYKIPEAVEVSSLSRSRLYELMDRGDLEFVKIGRSRRIPVDALESLVERLRAL